MSVVPTLSVFGGSGSAGTSCLSRGAAGDFGDGVFGESVRGGEWWKEGASLSATRAQRVDWMLADMVVEDMMMKLVDYQKTRDALRSVFQIRPRPIPTDVIPHD